jgi:hypothetical protein
MGHRVNESWKSLGRWSLTKLMSRILQIKGVSSVSSLIGLPFGTTMKTVDAAVYGTRLEQVGKTRAACRIAQWHSNGN